MMILEEKICEKITFTNKKIRYIHQTDKLLITRK